MINLCLLSSLYCRVPNDAAQRASLSAWQLIILPEYSCRKAATQRTVAVQDWLEMTTPWRRPKPWSSLVCTKSQHSEPVHLISHDRMCAVVATFVYISRHCLVHASSSLHFNSLVCSKTKFTSFACVWFTIFKLCRNGISTDTTMV